MIDDVDHKRREAMNPELRGGSSVKNSCLHGEMADARDLKSLVDRRTGSSPVGGTMNLASDSGAVAQWLSTPIFLAHHGWFESNPVPETVQ